MSCTNSDCCKIKKINRDTTTLDATIVPQCDPTVGTNGVFYKLEYGRGDKVVVRSELLNNKCKSKHNKNRKPLISFIQITDVHIIDACSPGRASFLAQYIREVSELQDSFRPQEGLTLQVADAMVRKINSIKEGPHTKLPISFIISTGDNGDSQQQNELQNYINVLDGKKVCPNTATPGMYIGVQDDTPTVNYESFYHPNDVGMTDNYKVGYGFPSYNNLLTCASEPFVPTGLIYPWYSCNGNHDCTKLGNYGLGNYEMLQLLNQLGTGTLPDGLGSKLIQAMTPEQAQAFALALQKQDASATLDIIKTSVLRGVPRSEKRLLYTAAEFISTHFNTTNSPGPIGHGFTHENVENGTLYYKFNVSEDIMGFTLNTCNPSGNLIDITLSPNGSIGRIQLGWLENELRKYHSNYYNVLGQIVNTENKDKLCILFSHHNHTTMNNIYNEPDAVDNDPQKIDGDEFIKIIQRYPNVILWVNGHTHRNIVTPLYNMNNFNSCFENKNYRYNGLWEINTCSFVDFPQQSRIIEVGDNMDGTLSIFGTIIDHLSPPYLCKKPCDCNYNITEMASISRTLSYNDPWNEPRTRGGLPKDRNVELLINNPLSRNC